MTSLGVDIVDIESLRRLCTRAPSFWKATMGFGKNYFSMNDFFLLAKKITEAEAAFKATSSTDYLADIRSKVEGSNSFRYKWDRSRYFLQFSNARTNEFYVSVCIAKRRFVLSRFLICLKQFWRQSRIDFRDTI